MTLRPLGQVHREGGTVPAMLLVVQSRCAAGACLVVFRACRGFGGCGAAEGGS